MTLALVTGITGQDGYYTSKVLLNAGIDVVALVRDRITALDACPDIAEKVAFETFDFMKPTAIKKVIDQIEPDFIFNYAAKSTGQGMFDEPTEMTRLNANFPLDILNAIMASNRKYDMCFVQASSSEMYGSNNQMPKNEASPCNPISPYGAAKLYVHNMIGITRRMEGIHASSAILFNHESPRRSEAFITKKIANAAARISVGVQDVLEIGNISSQRDWGYAPEYAEAIVCMARAKTADDYVVATGVMHSITDILKIAFSAVKLDYLDHIRINPKAIRKVDSKGHCGNISKITSNLGWTPKIAFSEIITEMVHLELARLNKVNSASKQT